MIFGSVLTGSIPGWQILILAQAADVLAAQSQISYR
jgi:hypothetical protein